MMLELLKRAVLPALCLRDAMRQWASVRHRLAEPPRKRIKQRETLRFILG